MGVQEYIDMDHAEPIPAARLSSPVEESFYLSMHGVVKESSTTTKFHVVFDGSAHSSTGMTLFFLDPRYTPSYLLFLDVSGCIRLL